MGHLIFSGILLLFTLLSTSASAYTFAQPRFALERYLEANPSQQALMDQFAVRVHNQPNTMGGVRTRAVRIGMLFTRPLSDVVSQRSLVAFKRRLQEIGVDFRLDLFELDQDSIKLQRQLIRVTTSGFDYLLLDNVTSSLVPQIQRWLLKRQPKLLLGGLSAPVDAWRHTPPLIYLGVHESRTMSQLASLVVREFENRPIDAMVLPAGKIAEQRCAAFLNGLALAGNSVRNSYAVSDSEQASYEAAKSLLQQDTPPSFLFSCTQTQQKGVVQAIQELGLAQQVKTNNWGEQSWVELVEDRVFGRFTLLYPIDDLAIAAAEALRADLENRLLPQVYIESVQIATAAMDLESLELMYGQSNRYGGDVWRP